MHRPSVAAEMRAAPGSAEELQHGLQYLVGLGQHGGAGLHHDLVAEADHLSGDVEVADAGLRSGR